MLFLEFQSTVDADMARRVLRNIGMAAERLRRNDALDPDKRLRALCIVIHSGRSRWTAPGAAEHVAEDDDGEVLALVALPYAAPLREGALTPAGATANISPSATWSRRCSN